MTLPSAKEIQKEDANFRKSERSNRKKCPVCFSSLKEEAQRPPDDFHCYSCNLIFTLSYLSVFWLGFDSGVDATVCNWNIDEGEEKE